MGGKSSIIQLMAAASLLSGLPVISQILSGPKNDGIIGSSVVARTDSLELWKSSRKPGSPSLLIKSWLSSCRGKSDCCSEKGFFSSWRGVSP